MKIDQRLNLVIPVGHEEERPDPKDATKKVREFIPDLYVHSTPISAETFEANFLLVSKTFSAIYGEGLGSVAGPRVAAMMLRRVAKATGDEASAVALMAEIRRLSNVLAPTPAGWDTVPLEQAVSQGTLSKEDASEVENAIVFFTVASAMHRRQDLKEAMDGAASLWGAQTTSSSFTAFRDSLPRSTAPETSPPAPTGEAAQAGSLVPQ